MSCISYLMEGNTSTSSMPLSPHEFIQIGWQLHGLHGILSYASVFPSLYSSMIQLICWVWTPVVAGINKIKGMIYHFMIENWNPLDSTVCCPLIRMDGYMWCSVGSYDGKETWHLCCITYGVLSSPEVHQDQPLLQC